MNYIYINNDLYRVCSDKLKQNILGGDVFLDVKFFVNYKFEILSEEDEEIDIDSITEMYISDIKTVGESITKCWTGRNLDITFANKVNDLIKAVKQLNKKLEEK